MEFIRTYLGEVVDFGVAFGWMSLLFVAMETLCPRDGVRISAASRWRAIRIWLVYVPIITLIGHGLLQIWAPLGVKPLLPDLAPAGLPRPLGVLIAALAAAFIGDFFYYWCHRAQHRFLWRFHAVHHSVREMSGVSGYHHVSEELFKFALYSVPLAFFIDDPFAWPVLGGLLAWQGNYLHSATRLNFGPLGRYFADNRFHRIHHSIEPQHVDRNFGVFTTLWDELFGTAHHPAADEWPATGVADFPEPRSIGEYLAAPFVHGATTPARPILDFPALTDNNPRLPPPGLPAGAMIHDG
ncbi:MAG: sterol desaturase family protein [Caulobacterales bacterium]